MKTMTILLLLAILATGCEKRGSVTSLKITVRDSTPRLVSGATVRLFNNESDMVNNVNQLGLSKTTNADGIVIFSDLSTDQLYAYRVETGCRNNLFPWSDTSDYHTLPATLEAGEENEVMVLIAPAGAMLKLVNNSAMAYQISGYMYYYPALQPYQIRTDHLFPGDYFIRITSPNSSMYVIDTTLHVSCGDTTTLTFP